MSRIVCQIYFMYMIRIFTTFKNLEKSAKIFASNENIIENSLTVSFCG